MKKWFCYAMSAMAAVALAACSDKASSRADDDEEDDDYEDFTDVESTGDDLERDGIELDISGLDDSYDATGYVDEEVEVAPVEVVAPVSKAEIDSLLDEWERLANRWLALNKKVVAGDTDVVEEYINIGNKFMDLNDKVIEYADYFTPEQAQRVFDIQKKMEAVH